MFFRVADIVNIYRILRKGVSREPPYHTKISQRRHRRWFFHFGCVKIHFSYDIESELVMNPLICSESTGLHKYPQHLPILPSLIHHSYTCQCSHLPSSSSSSSSSSSPSPSYTIIAHTVSISLPDSLSQLHP